MRPAVTLKMGPNYWVQALLSGLTQIPEWKLISDSEPAWKPQSQRKSQMQL